MVITTDELMQKLHAGPVALFDVRGDVEFEQGHIPNAMTAPLGSLVFRVANVMKPDSLVVVYSAGGDCSLSAQASSRLANLGMRNVLCFAEGLKGWQEAGHSIVPSVNPKTDTFGPVKEVRPLIVDREKAYGGAFKGKPVQVEGAGG